MYLPQDGQLFTGTFADNLRLAKPDATDDELTAALVETGLGHLLDRLPQGIHSAVGGRGGRLSAGERQLIALARVALRDPAVVILDESTSRIDDETAARLDAALRRLGEQRCLVTIAHRPSTIASADAVYRLEDGAVTRARHDAPATASPVTVAHATGARPPGHRPRKCGTANRADIDWPAPPPTAASRAAEPTQRRHRDPPPLKRPTAG